MKWDYASRLKASPFDAAAWSRVSLDDAPGPRAAAARDSIELDDGRGGDALFDAALDELMRYHVFPPHRMRSRVCSPDATVAPGATIIQRLFLGLIGFECATRVTKVFDERSAEIRRAGFAYGTLAGHPERGRATFAVERPLDHGPTRFTIETVSEPGHWLARLAAPVARRAQRRATAEALSHFRALVRGGE